MGADKTAIKKRRKKFYEHDNHSRITSVWNRRQVLICSWQWCNYDGSRYSNAAGPGRVGGPGPINNKKYCWQRI